jgi:hypothetical protein
VAPSSDSSSTPWGWIVAGLILLAALAAAVVWAIARRRATARGWHDGARQAETDGTALHDAAVGELIAAGAANRPERWSDMAQAADALAAALARLEAPAPGDTERRAVAGAAAAVTGLRSALAIAGGAPAGTPLDNAARDTIRARLEELASALPELRSSAGNGFTERG